MSNRSKPQLGTLRRRAVSLLTALTFLVLAVTYVLGAERQGLPDDVVAACDETATIPLAPGAESLNVAIAGAIALYEHRRRGRDGRDVPV